MTPKRRPRGQRSGHCQSGATGGHGRCPSQLGPALYCACTCHAPTSLPEVRP